MEEFIMAIERIITEMINGKFNDWSQSVLDNIKSQHHDDSALNKAFNDAMQENVSRALKNTKNKTEAPYLLRDEILKDIYNYEKIWNKMWVQLDPILEYCERNSSIDRGAKNIEVCIDHLAVTISAHVHNECEGLINICSPWIEAILNKGNFIKQYMLYPTEIEHLLDNWDKFYEMIVSKMDEQQEKQ